MIGNYSTSEYMKKALSAFSVEPTNTAIKDYLLYYKAWDEKGRKSPGFRKTHDLDCVAMEGNLYADTIFSFWMILKMYLQAYFPGEFAPGARRGPNKNKEVCEMLLLGFEKYFNPDETGRDINIFAALAQTKANFMLLPDRAMQNRGMLYYDQMPITLYQCFEGGIYEKYFAEISAEEWVHTQKLESFFEGIISKDTIKSLGPVNSKSAYWCSSKEEVCAMLKSYIEILRLRGIAGTR